MKIFISWSGNKSKLIAEYLKKWIEQIIQSAEPWISVDIEKGKKWNQEISQNLEESKVGILCVTRDNINAPWMLFEAGAISKSADSFVCTFLIDLTPTDLTGPLSIFQATKFNKEDVHKLLATINQIIHKQNGKSLSDENLKSLFDVFYPKLEEKISSISKTGIKEDDKVLRTDRELLEESVQILRTLKQSKIAQSTDAKKLLNFYAEKYANYVGSMKYYEVGTKAHIDKFLSYIEDNPLLIEFFGSKDDLKDYIAKQFDGLPF
jgi:Mor family transcriptional regulator